jgi:hypothetical protein
MRREVARGFPALVRRAGGILSILLILSDPFWGFLQLLSAMAYQLHLRHFALDTDFETEI